MFITAVSVLFTTENLVLLFECDILRILCNQRFGEGEIGKINYCLGGAIKPSD